MPFTALLTRCHLVAFGLAFLLGCAMSLTRSTSSSSAVRLVTYNVARFTTDAGVSSFERVIRNLVNLSPTVLCLNEVDVSKLESRGESLAQIADALGGYHVAFFGHVQGRYGNAVLSKHPIRSRREIHLKGGTVVPHKEGEYRIHRGLLVVEIEVPTWTPQAHSLTVACTHLDHIAEREREVQLDHVIESLEPHRSVVLLGDLNALTRSDYSDAHWDVLRKCNRAQGWAPPQHGCLGKLEKAGFADSWTHSRTDRQAGWTARRIDVGDRRIDYIWLGQDLLQQATVEGCRVAQDIDVSDHFPLVVDLSVTPAAAVCPPAAL